MGYGSSYRINIKGLDDTHRLSTRNVPGDLSRPLSLNVKATHNDLATHPQLDGMLRRVLHSTTQHLPKLPFSSEDSVSPFLF